MKFSDTPKGGDFASYVLGKNRPPVEVSVARPVETASASSKTPRQTIGQVLTDGEEPTEEFLEEWNALQHAPEFSDEEFERQALDSPGADGDSNTPE